jgi:signal transduction histidine kinase/CheY-like chemotaxis protein
MAVPRTLILAGNAEILEDLATVAAALPWVAARGVAFDVVDGDVQSAIELRRQREPEGPLGFVGRDEPGALAALSGGADEAAVHHRFDGPSLAALVDRVELRARRRVETQRLHAAFAHAEKLTALGTLVAGIGHEINNPLSAVMLCLDVARRQLLPVLDVASEIAHAAERDGVTSPALLARLRSVLPGSPRRDGAGLFDDMGSAVNAIASIVRDLRVFARTDDEELPELLDVRVVIEHVLRLVGREATKHGLVECDFADDVPHLVVSRNRLTQVLVNVLVNATHAIAEIERPVHRIRVSVRSDGEFVAIAVSDTGPGIPSESLERIFDPFYTTKRQELGTGLGLSISRSILRGLRGELAVESVYGEGATFVCLLPIPTRETVRDAWKKAAAESFIVPASAGTSVMVVDDDPRMLRSYGRLLSGEHRIVMAHGGREAIDLLESGSAATIAIVELDLPDEEGPALLSWIAANRPELSRRTLVVAGGEAESRYAEFLGSYRGPLLHKPVRGSSLLAAVGALLEDRLAAAGASASS